MNIFYCPNLFHKKTFQPKHFVRSCECIIVAREKAMHFPTLYQNELALMITPFANFLAIGINLTLH